MSQGLFLSHFIIQILIVGGIYNSKLLQPYSFTEKKMLFAPNVSSELSTKYWIVIILKELSSTQHSADSMFEN